MEKQEKLSIQEMKERIEEYRSSMAQIESILDREKGDVKKLTEVNELSKVYDNIKKSLLYYSEVIAYEESKLIVDNDKVISPSDIGKVCSVTLQTQDGKHISKEVPPSSRIHNARLLDLLDGEQVLVKLIPSGETIEIASKHCKPNKLHSRQNLKIGFSCEALFSQDGEFYDATITELSDSKITVLFTGYGNSEQIGYDSIRISPDQAIRNQRLATGIEGRKEKAVDLSKGVVIPEHLRITPADSEQNRLAKRKKVKALKHSHKMKVLELESREKQENWNCFLKNKKKGIGAVKVRKEGVDADFEGRVLK